MAADKFRDESDQFVNIRALLYDADGHDENVDVTSDLVCRLTDDQLLWIDIEGQLDATAVGLGAILGVTPEMVKRVTDVERPPYLDNYPNCFAFAIDAPDERDQDGADKPGAQLGFIVGDRWLLTIHAAPVAYLNAFTAQDKGETAIGKLSPALLAASLLDWHLTQYFVEVADIEASVDKLDVEILNEGTHRSVLARIVAIRTRVSKLRAQLATQRPIFYGFARPDFMLNYEKNAIDPFARLSVRYDRAIDEVERTRDVVVGSFELFTSMTTEQTNTLVKALTLLTAVIGFCGLIAGVLGMNFDLPFLKTGLIGFEQVVGSMVGISVIAVIVARWRRWV